jgi:hypothetical protein
MCSNGHHTVESYIETVESELHVGESCATITPVFLMLKR